MNAPRGVGNKLLRVFALQLVTISAAAVIGVWAAASVIEGSLMREALEGEADLFEEHLNHDPDTPTPSTVNLTAYLRSRGSVPAEFTGLKPGFHSLEDGADRILVMVRDIGGGSDRMVLRFEAGHVTRLAVYFGIVPLTVVLLGIYLTAWIAYRLSRRSVSPIIKLAESVESLDLDDLQHGAFAAPADGDDNSEVATLRCALERLNHRVHALLERERSFTRDASHQLRTPLSIIQMAADILHKTTPEDSRQHRTIDRIRRASCDMHGMLEALLLLARHEATELDEHQFDVDRVAREAMQRCATHLRKTGASCEVIVDHSLRVQGPPRIASLVLEFLIRNVARLSTKPKITVVIGVASAAVHVEDTERRPRAVPDVDDDTIMHRLAVLAGWRIDWYPPHEAVLVFDEVGETGATRVPTQDSLAAEPRSIAL